MSQVSNVASSNAILKLRSSTEGVSDTDLIERFDAIQRLTKTPVAEATTLTSIGFAAGRSAKDEARDFRTLRADTQLDVHNSVALLQTAYELAPAHIGDLAGDDKKYRRKVENAISDFRKAHLTTGLDERESIAFLNRAYKAGITVNRGIDLRLDKGAPTHVGRGQLLVAGGIAGVIAGGELALMDLGKHSEVAPSLGAIVAFASVAALITGAHMWYTGHRDEQFKEQERSFK